METKRKLMSGNEAIAEGAIRAGCAFYAGYPITPQTELTAYMARWMPENGRVFIQAESELAAVNMLLGASAAGMRAMTSSSSPGISLKQEGISYMAGMELPAVIVNVMRAGPGLGNITPSQSDYFQAVKGGGHGDYHPIVLAPASVQEAFDLTREAFALADLYRTPAMILGDGMLGQMMEPLVVREPVGKIPERDYALSGCAGRQARVVRSLYLKEGVLEEINLGLQKKYAEIIKKEQRWEAVTEKDADIMLVAYGGMSRIVKSCVRKARQAGIRAGLIRPISLWPFPEKAFEGYSAKTKFLVVEMSYGQMIEDVKLSLCRRDVAFTGRAGGGIPSEESIMQKIKELS